VLVYSSSWNNYWQINKTIALTLTYIYSCINPFALYFLSSTFRHFYKRYLCFCVHRHTIKHQQRRPTRDLTSSHQYRSSLTNTPTTTVYYDLNRVKTLSNHRRHSP
jgi:hypothetical protein